MTRRQRLGVWLRGAGHVRLLRVRPGDTLVITFPGPIPLAHVEDVRRHFEDILGLRNDVQIIALGENPALTVLREQP